VSGVDRRVSRLLHRSQHEERDRPLFRPVADALEEFLEMPRPQRSQWRAQTQTESRDELFELRHLEHIGFFVNAIEGWRVLRLEKGCDGFVGQKHELFDEAMSDVPL
jgi:hypothetical protein